MGRVVFSHARRISVVIIGGLLLLGGIASVTVDTRSEMAQARDWAGRMAAARTLPTTLDGLLAVPAAYRLAAKELFAPAQHAAVWQAWFAKFENEHNLNAEQRAWMKEMRSYIQPALYDPKSPAHATLSAGVTALCQKKWQLFSEREATALSNIGPLSDPPASKRWMVSFVRTLESALGAVALRADPTPDCACNPALEPWCGKCKDEKKLCKELDCTVVYFACGCAGNDTCTKPCALPDPGE